MTPLRTLILAACAAVTVAGTARADVNYIIDNTPPIPAVFQTQQPFKSNLSIAMVRSQDGGTVELRDYRLGEPGTLIGTQSVHSGANADVRFDLGIYRSGRLIAILYDPAGTEVARRVIWRR